MVDEPPILLVAGLGNPGSRYAWTWHNLGFLALDYWATDKGLTFKPGRGDYYHLDYHSPHGVITFLKPTSYMNLSGIPISEMMRYRKLSPENVLIICDDVALPLGTIRIRKMGSDGGHKGLSSVIAFLNSEYVPRLRLGIYTEGWPGELRDYVLSRIPDVQRENIEKLLAICREAVDCILTEGLEPAMNRFNSNFLKDDEQQE